MKQYKVLRWKRCMVIIYDDLLHPWDFDEIFQYVEALKTFGKASVNFKERTIIMKLIGLNFIFPILFTILNSKISVFFICRTSTKILSHYILMILDLVLNLEEDEYFQVTLNFHQSLWCLQDQIWCLSELEEVLVHN